MFSKTKLIDFAKNKKAMQAIIGILYKKEKPLTEVDL